MTASGAKPTPSIGFVTVVDAGEHGVFGGYLVLNTVGRPLEFHCTAPVKPNRAQEILFGPTLEAFLYGEQIAKTLVAKSKLNPLFICTDHAAVLSLRTLIKQPVLLVLGAGAEPTAVAVRRFTLAESDVAVDGSFAADAEQVQKLYAEHEGCLDLAEPFGRIREAIEEAKRGRRENRAA